MTSVALNTAVDSCGAVDVQDEMTALLALQVPRQGLPHGDADDIGLQALAEDEALERDEYESIIRKGWQTFLEVGRALAKIREKRLYRDQFHTFEEYCRRKWEFSKTHANRLIEAATVADILAPIGVKVRKESHVRALVWLSPQRIIAAWQKAEQLARGGEVTARLIREAAEEFRGDCTAESAPTLAKAPSLTHTALQSALRLIDRAEKAAKRQDTQAILNALGDLRERLLKYSACR